MTVPELLAQKRTRYLFTQDGWRYYACGKSFYKVWENVILPADRKEEKPNARAN